MTTGIRLTANEFLTKLRRTEEGRVYSGPSGLASDIRVLVVEPKEEKGVFLAPPATMFRSDESFFEFVEEIEQLTEPSPFSDSGNRIISKPNGMKKISASQFINRLKRSEKGEIKPDQVDGNSEITLIVTEPAEACGTFMAPCIDAFNYDFIWYSEFINEIVKLLMISPEERKKFKIRTQLPDPREVEGWEKEGNNDEPDRG